MDNHLVIRTQQRRRRQREMLMLQADQGGEEEQEEDCEDLHQYPYQHDLDEEEEVTTATNDFASLEALLMASDQTEQTQINAQDDPVQEEENFSSAALPSSPSTLSNESLLESPQKNTLHQHHQKTDITVKSFSAAPLFKQSTETKKIRRQQEQEKKKTMKKPTIAHTAKSIVGSRPKHWSAVRTPPTGTNHSHSSGGGNGGGDRFLQASRQKRKALLAAELNKAASKARNRLNHQPQHPLHTNKKRKQQQPIHEDKEEEEGNKPAVAVADVSFAPSFFSPPIQLPGQQQAADAAPETVENSDSLEMQQQQQHERLPWILSPQQQQQQQRAWPSSMASPAPRKSKQQQHSKGPLTKRLKSIRTAIEGDAIRLKSGQYPFSARSVDRNDPRNRADTVCDVTVLGNPTVWGGDAASDKLMAGGRSGSSNHHHHSKQQQHRLLTALSYVHSWTSLSNNGVPTPVNESADGNINSLQPPAAAAVQGLVWAVFTHDTAREQSLGPGTELRIYNAVRAPFGLPPITKSCTTSPKPSRSRNVDAIAAATATADVQHLILCTNLCEPYPASVLPPLPNVSSTSLEHVSNLDGTT